MPVRVGAAHPIHYYVYRSRVWTLFHATSDGSGFDCSLSVPQGTNAIVAE